MATTFTITNPHTSLNLNMSSSNINQELQLFTAQSGDTWEFWQFVMSDTESGCFQIVNYNTKLPLGVIPPNGVVSSPVAQVATGSGTAFTVRPNSAGGNFELIFPDNGTSWSAGYQVVNIPEGLYKKAGNKALNLPLQVSPGNGGQWNELWTLTNTVSPAPALTLDPDNAVAIGGDSEYGTFSFPFSVTNYSGKPITVLSLAIPGTGNTAAFGIGGAISQPVTEANGVYEGQLVVDMLPGSAPQYAPLVTVVALDTDNYAIAFIQISSQYFYQGTWG